MTCRLSPGTGKQIGLIFLDQVTAAMHTRASEMGQTEPYQTAARVAAPSSKPATPAHGRRSPTRLSASRGGFTPVTGPAGWRPWRPSWAISGHRYQLASNTFATGRRPHRLCDLLHQFVRSRQKPLQQRRGVRAAVAHDQVDRRSVSL
jgi:hypothetical protein